MKNLPSEPEQMSIPTNSVNIVTFEGNHKINFDEDALGKILLHPEVRDRSVVVISISGAFRRGKSFLLDYFLRFMYNNYDSIHCKRKPSDSRNENDSITMDTEWLGNPNEPLKGFSWRGGTEKDTLGISFWPDVFLHDCSRRGEIAIILMDTQGLFDNETSQQDNARIFSLSILMSSTQIFNLTGLIQEDQLQYLQFATEYAKFNPTGSDTVSSPFQHFIFLIRDWQNMEDNAYGWEGGETYLNQVLKIKDIHDEESRDLRDYIGESFKKMDCFLMPHPGNKVFSKNFDGRYSLLDHEFVEQLKNFVPQLLTSKNLTIKGVYNRYIKASQLHTNIGNYIKLYNSDILPEPKSIYQTTIDSYFNSFVESIVENYRKFIGEGEPKIKSDEGIKALHAETLIKSDEEYSTFQKIGKPENETKYKQILLEKLNHEYELWQKATTQRLKREEAERLREEDNKKNAGIIEDQARTISDLQRCCSPFGALKYGPYIMSGTMMVGGVVSAVLIILL